MTDGRPAPDAAPPARVRFLQHAAGEGAGALADWAAARGHAAAVTRLHRGEPLPAADALDALVVLGGPMGVGDAEPAPWLAGELALVRACVAAGRPVLGVCFGAQLLAHALGAPVTRAPEPEIGWFPVEREPSAAAEPLLAGVPARFDAFHWHADTFALPDGARPLFRSAACARQGFAWGDRVVGLQFHPEVTPEIAARLVAADATTLAAGGRWVQPGAGILAAPPARYAAAREAARAALDRMLAAAGGR